MKQGLKALWIFFIASAMVFMMASFVRPISVSAQTGGTETGIDAETDDEGSSASKGTTSDQGTGGTTDDTGLDDEGPAFNNPAQAQHAANLAEAAAEQAEALADQAKGVTVGDIAAMRDNGMGWGQIAHELGVHPSSLGLGHTKGKKSSTEIDETENTEMQEATRRDLKSGLSKGHGVGNGKGSGKGAAGGKGNKSSSEDSSGGHGGKGGGKGGKK